MNYTKPEVVLNGLALVAIQGIQKSDVVATDQLNQHPFEATAAAYEADE